MLLLNPPSFKVRPGVSSSLQVRGRAAILASPLQIHAYIIKVPVLKPKLREKAIRRELRFRYPGNAGEADIDYFYLSPVQDGVDGPYYRAAVFVAERGIVNQFRREKARLFPGLAFLIAGFKTLGQDQALVVLISKAWVEAASFRDGELFNYSALDRKTVLASINFFTCLSPCTRGKSYEGPVLIILKDPEEHDEYAASLSCHFKNCRISDIRDLSNNISPSKYSIYRSRYKGRKINLDLILIPIFALHGFSLLFSVLLFMSKTEVRIADLNRIYTEQQGYQRETERLLDEIAKLEKPADGLPPEQEARRIPDPYAVIAEIHRRMEGVLVHSIIIQGKRFNFEAEGPDSLRAVRNLGESPYFSSITLHQSSPSNAVGERFSVSGSIDHE
jgi:hypothetical protein